MINIKPNDYITIPEASDLSDISYLIINRAVKAKKIPSEKNKNKITMIYSDFEKWWKEYRKEEDLKIEKINKSKEIFEKINGSENNYYGKCTPVCSPVKKYENPSDSEFLDKDITYICKSFDLKPKSTASVEILSLIKAFRSSKITIKATDLLSNKETFCEICNVTVLGEPQLVSFNGVTDSSLRGSSLLFSDLDVSNWGIFGCSPGQGLIIDVCNPHESQIKIEILISGWETKSSYLCNRVWITNKNRIAFSKINVAKNSISVMKIFAGRSGALKPNFWKIQSDKSLKITNILVLKKQQIRFVNENSEISSDLFSNLSKINIDSFGSCDSQGLEISFKNEYDYDVEVYVSILGEIIDEDLVGTR